MPKDLKGPILVLLVKASLEEAIDNDSCPPPKLDLTSAPQEESLVQGAEEKCRVHPSTHHLDRSALPRGETGT